MPERFRAILRAKEHIARNIARFDFSPSIDSFSFVPGQHVQLKIPAIFDVSKPDGIRNFLLIYDPEKPSAISIATVLTGSKFKSYLLDCPIGNSIEAFGPLGSFKLPEQNDPVCMIAEGIGITAMISLIRYSIAHERRHITLLYSSKDVEDMAFSKELTGIASEDSLFTYLPFLTDSDHPLKEFRSGEITANAIQEAVGEKLETTTFMVAGPPGKVKRIREGLGSIGVSQSRIKVEIYTGYE